MKKFILVMVFVLLAALFVAFNYLLWDRESKVTELKDLENANAGNNAMINSQKREIENLVEENKNLNNRIDELDKENKQLAQDNSNIKSDRDNKAALLDERIKFINSLKQIVDLKSLTEPLAKWADAINQGNYEEAYAVEYAGMPLKDRTVDLGSYSEDMKKTVRRIEIIDVKIDPIRGSGDGNLYLDLKLSVKLAEGADMSVSRFVEGENSAYVKFDYSADQKAFVISGINQ
jgi:cell division protein FtsB